MRFRLWWSLPKRVPALNIDDLLLMIIAGNTLSVVVQESQLIGYGVECKELAESTHEKNIESTNIKNN